MTEEDIARIKAAAEAEGWETIPYLDNGRMTAVGVIKGTEFHCQLADTCRLNRERMREFLRPLLAREGFLTTRTLVSDTSNQRFNKLFGFKKTWSDGEHNFFILTKLPFERKETCQQQQL